MNSHFCKVGRIRPNLTKVINLKELEKKYYSFIEEAYNVMQTDASLSDFLYHEASKLKKSLITFKKSSTSYINARF